MSADGIANKLLSIVAATLNQAGDDVLKDVQQRLSVPVEHVPGGTIRSAAGEPPRREQGGYQEGFQVASSSNGDVASVEVSNPTADGLDHWLENGTTRMAPRPHIKPTYAEWRERITQRLAITIRSDFHI